MERERLGSRLGFILIAAGCAIGLGNIWKFPYMVGQYGGGAFVLIYLVFLVVLGVPLLSMELSIGRASQRSPVNMCRELEPEGTRWHLHGYLSMAGVYLLMSFYTVITGWILRYAVSSATGGFDGLDASGVSGFFASMSGDPVVTVGFMVIVVIIGFTVCSLGLRGGLERVTKWMMLALLVIMVFLVAYSFTMPGAAEGLRFYLVPDIDRMMDQGILKVVVAAMSQAFFTLSIGIGSMAVFGSYIGKEHRLFGESVRIAALDLAVAFMAGLIIFPACFSFDVPVGVGPSLIFETLPNIFNNLPSGNILGFLFFIFMSFAALSTVFAVYECIVSNSMEVTGWSRRRACMFNIVVMCLLCLPCALGFNVLSGFEPLGAGSTVLDLSDLIFSQLMLPIGSVMMVLFCVSRRGWGWDRFMSEVNSGEGLVFPARLRTYMTYVVPVMVAIL
ncbi:MAG: sodium-dependent transporter, partial [Candidatus Methanomethylophilaceae archaeon]